MKLFILIFSIMMASVAQAEMKVEFKISKMHGFFDFLETISGQPHHSDVILKVFQDSKYNTPELEPIINDLRTSKEAMPGFYFNRYHKSRTLGSDLETILNIQSIFSNDLNDFSSRMLGLLPISDHAKYFSAAKKLLPIYEKLIWNPSLSDLKKYREKLLKVSKKAKLDELFMLAVKFYGAEWPKEQAFVISLYPTPGTKGGTSSTSLGAAESVGVMMSDNDAEGTFGVVFHELCHSLYQAQPVDFKYQLEKMFLSHHSIYSPHAYDLLNEGLATVLGNGYAEKMATGKLNSHKWYNNPYIDGFAKAIYPMVEDYLQKGKTIDQVFINKSVGLLESAMPQSIYEYDNFFQWVYVLQGGGVIKRTAVRNAFYKNFRVNSWSSHDPMDSAEVVTDAPLSHHTLLTVYAHSEVGQLQMLSEKIPYLKAHYQELKSKSENYIFSGLDAKGRAYVFIQIAKEEDFQKALETLKTKKKINLEQPFITF